MTNDANDPRPSNAQHDASKPRTYGEALDADQRQRRDLATGDSTPQENSPYVTQAPQSGQDAWGSASAPAHQQLGNPQSYPTGQGAGPEQHPGFQQPGWLESGEQQPGQAYQGQPSSSQQYPGQQYSGQQYPGQQYPGHQYPGGAASWNTPDPQYGPGGYQGQAATPGWTPAAPAGLFPLRPLSFGDIFGATFRLLRFSPAASFGGAFLLQFLSALIAAIAPLAVFLSNTDNPIFNESSAWTSAHTQFMAWFLLSLVPSVLVTVTSTAVVQTIVAQVTAAAAIGQRVTLGQTLRRAVKRLFPVLGYLILMSLISITLVGVLIALPLIWLITTTTTDQSPLAAIGMLFLSVILLIVIMVFINTKFMFGVAIVVLEEVGPITALRRSWALTNGLFWRTFGINLLVSMLVSTATSMATQAIGLVLALLGQALFPMSSQSDPTAPDMAAFAIAMSVVAALATSMFTAIHTVLVSGNITVLYADARMRKEGLNVALQSAADMVAAGNQPPTDTWQMKPSSTAPSSWSNGTPPPPNAASPNTW